MSRVKTPDARPYSVALALLRTSSTSLRNRHRRETGQEGETAEGKKTGFSYVVFHFLCAAVNVGKRVQSWASVTHSWTWKWSWRGRTTPLERCTCGLGHRWTGWVQRKNLEGRQNKSKCIICHVRGGPCRLVNTRDSLHFQASVQITLPYLVAAPVCHRRPEWLPPWGQSDSTPPVCRGGLCGSEGRGLWSGPVDHRSSFSWPPQPERKDNQIRQPQR